MSVQRLPIQALVKLSYRLTRRTFAKVGWHCHPRHCNGNASSRCRVPRDETLGPMGKSKKKIKADQINILRKQYDAFLEEDRKRKERNEHIMDKLDKMRLANSVARYKSNIYLYQRVPFNCAGESPIKTYPHPETNQPSLGSSLRKLDPLVPTEIDVLAKPLDEAYILNEISKKYILIPKLRSLVSEDYIPRAVQDNNNDNDWKSKYSILDKLKENEKEETNNLSTLKDCSERFLDDIPSKEPKYRAEDAALEITSNRDLPNIKNDTVTTKYDTNLEKNRTANNLTTDAEKENTSKQFDNIHKLNTNVSEALKTDTEFVAVNKDMDTSGANGEQDQYEPDGGQYDYTTSDMQGHAAKNIDRGDQQSYVVYSDKHENEDTEKLSHVVDDIRHVEVIDSIKPAAQKANNDKQNLGNPEKLEYPIDIINVKDFTPEEGVPLGDGVNVNPDGHNAQQAHLAADQSVSKPPSPADQAHQPGPNQPPGGDHYVSEPTSAEQAYLPGAGNQAPTGEQYVSEPIAVTAEHKDNVLENADQQLPQEGAYDPDTVTSEIEAFEAEQNQMFYNEQANYQDQNGLGDVYSPETANYDPSLYYAGVQQEPPYPAEINEHEETSQRYDPSYEEQYAAKDSEYEQYPQQYAEQQQYDEQQYGEEQQYSEQQYAEQENGEQQQYGEQQHYGEQQQYGEQQVGQILGSSLITTAQEYGEEPIEALNEQQTMEQIEQQLDNEEFGVPNQDGGVGDIVDESVLYTQDASDVAATEPTVQNQNVENPQPSS